MFLTCRKCDTLQTRYPPRDHGLRVGFPYHYLTTPPLSKGFPLSTTCGRAEQFCEFEPWEPTLEPSTHMWKTLA